MEEENRTSKFSSGLNIISRLDELWKMCHKFKREGKYADWNDELDTVWLELARDLDEKEYNDELNEKKEVISKGYKSKFNEFENKLKSLLPFNDNMRGFSKPDDGDIKRRNEQYKILMEKELFLRRLENFVGKGTAWDDDEDDF